MKLYSSKMKSYLLFVLGCLIFVSAGQITDLTANNSSDATVFVTEANSSSTSETPVTTPPSSNTTTTIIITTTAAANVTTSSPSTTALPPPVNDPSTGSWTVYGVNGTNCIKLEAAIQFRIKYEQISGNNVTAKLNLPTNATVENNTCDNAFIKLTFGQNTFQIFFKNESNEISATKFTFQYFMDPIDFPDAKQQSEMEFVSAPNLTEFKASAGKSFLCKIETKIDMKNVELSMQDLRVEAFRQSKEDKFSEATECAGDEKINDIVPIAVGCALAVLVIIVLIAYLVGRQRSRQQGYQSV